MRRWNLVLPLLLLVVLAGLIVWGVQRAGDFFRPADPESVASATLQAVREQARLVPFTADYVAVVTSSQRRFGLRAERTLILPGTVRYELDLERLSERDLAWEGTSQTLSISLPPLEISRPEIDMNRIQEYDGGTRSRIVTRLTDAGDVLDQANREAAQQELMRQARQPVPMRLARDAAKRAVARSFALPLRATGIDANVEVRFADEAGTDEPSYLDRSRRVEDVLRERQADR
jgi:hypothetical protein